MVDSNLLTGGPSSDLTKQQTNLKLTDQADEDYARQNCNFIVADLLLDVQCIHFYWYALGE